MRLTRIIALGAALALFAMPALPAAAAAFAPDDLNTLSVPVAASPSVEHDVRVCQLAVVEDLSACAFAIVADAHCAPDLAPALAAYGKRLLASADFLGACLSPRKGYPDPPS
jgi:hypothetical protein